MGADVMRWLYCEQPPSQTLRFGYGLADEVKRRLLTFWNSVSFFVTYANIAGFEPAVGRAAASRDARSTAGSSRARAQLVRDATDAYERYWTPEVIARVRRLRRRPLELVHPPLPPALLGRRRGGAPRRSGTRSSQALRVIAPVMPFLAEHLWRNLRPATDESVFLAGWPEAARAATRRCSRRSPRCARVVELGRQARDASRLKLRQPLRRLVVQGASRAAAHADEIADELRVKEVEFGEVEATELRVKPNLPVLGPKLGKELGAVRAALEAGEFEELDGGRFRAAGHELEPEEVLVERRGRRAGRSRRRTGSPSRSTPRSTTSSSSRGASST